MQTQQLPMTPVSFDHEDHMQLDNEGSLSLFDISPEVKKSHQMAMTLPPDYSFEPIESSTSFLAD